MIFDRWLRYYRTPLNMFSINDNYCDASLCSVWKIKTSMKDIKASLPLIVFRKLEEPSGFTCSSSSWVFWISWWGAILSYENNFRVWICSYILEPGSWNSFCLYCPWKGRGGVFVIMLKKTNMLDNFFFLFSFFSYLNWLYCCLMICALLLYQEIVSWLPLTF